LASDVNAKNLPVEELAPPRGPLQSRAAAASCSIQSEAERALDRDAEIELARRLMAGDAEAFDSFVEHFRSKIFHYSWLMCRQREDAEEVAQETLLTVFENFDQLREPERVRPWVFQIAKNTCLMKRRKSVFAPAAEVSLAEDGAPQIADWAMLPDNQLMQAEMRAALDESIGELPDIYRSVLLLRDVEELSTADTAHILDVTEDVVKTRLRRARLALRQKLSERLHAARG
jgi:RNA polymerase sigma-70 factor, ECF subfamily